MTLWCWLASRSAATVTLTRPLLSEGEPLPYRPFLDPIDVHTHWYVTLVPLAFMTAVAYKAIRIQDPSAYWRHVAKMTLQIVALVVLLGAAFYLAVEILVPALAPMPE